MKADDRTRWKSESDEGLYRGGTFKRDNTKKSPVEILESDRIRPALERRRKNASLRQLHSSFFRYPETERNGTIDFSSNDYLGLARSSKQHQKVEDIYRTLPTRSLGSTGSRLLTGDSEYAQRLEKRLAEWHKRPSAILCNSGYDANLSVMSCLSRNSTVIMDELCHNSIQMGVRLSRNCILRKFRHSNLRDLEILLLAEQNNTMRAKKTVIVVVESVYSMDGDLAPLKEILDMALAHNGCVIVDEAHGLGIVGENGLGLLEEYRLENHPSLLCSVHTFGKAAGCHGAVICSSLCIKNFLLNYAYPIIYSTSIPLHSLVCIACSYETMTGNTGTQLRQEMRDLMQLFRKLLFEKILSQYDHNTVRSSLPIELAPSESPINALIIPGNTRCQQFCDKLWVKSNRSIRLYPIRSPTVPKGRERVRIVLHSHNTQDQVIYLVNLIKSTLCDMAIIPDITPPHDMNGLDLISRL